MLEKKDKRRYAKALRRLEYGYWGYPASLFRSITLTTWEGQDNTVETFMKDLKWFVESFRKDGYKVEYCGALSWTPQKGLLHWHGLFRIAGGYFICPLADTATVAIKQVRKRWSGRHGGAFEVDCDVVHSEKEMREYIVKHILKGYLDSRLSPVDALNSSRGWVRLGLKKVVKEVEYFVSKGKGRRAIDSAGWALLNEIVECWCRGDDHLWRSGDLACFVHGHICEVYDYRVSEVVKEGVGK